MGALDVIDAGAGSDTLTIEESVAIPSLPATFKGVETVNISTTEGDIGAIYKAGTAAGTNTAAVAQKATVVLTGTYATGDTIDVVIGGVVTTVTVGDTSSTSTTGQAEAATAVSNALSAALADSVTVASVSTGSSTHSATSTHTIGLTSKAAGTPLPSISVTNNTVAGTATASMATAASAQSTSAGAVLFAADVTKTGPVAIKEVEQITIVDAGNTASTATDIEAGTIITVNVGGVPYAVAATGASSATAATAAETAVNVASAINTALGGTTAAPLATASGAIVTVTAPTAGTPIPTINVEFANASDFTATVATATANQAANTAAIAAESAVAVGAPTGATSYTATAAAGNANVSGAKTTDLTVKGKVVQTSGGADVAVTASDSVFVKGATGAVTVKAGATTTSIKGAVTSDSGATAGDAAGIYVTGGTTVDITGSKTTTGAIKVGAAGYAKAAANTTGGLPQSNGNAANTPTGDVTISTSKVDTSSTTGLKNLVYGTGARDVYTNGAESVTVKGGTAVSVTDVQTTALQSTAGVAAAPGTSTLAKVTLAELSGNASITSDALTDIYLSDTLSARTVTVSNSGAEGVNTSIALHTSNTGTAANPNVLNHATAESVVLGSTAANANYSVGGTANNTGSASFITLTTPKATAVTAVNTLGVTLGDYLANAPKIASINASGATGSVNVIIDSTPLQGTSYIGGAGKDKVTLKASSNLSPNATTGSGDDHQPWCGRRYLSQRQYHCSYNDRCND
jgi:ribosomal 50S subunit-recycling heat shock protein